jgi:hypothetical protein
MNSADGSKVGSALSADRCALLRTGDSTQGGIVPPVTTACEHVDEVRDDWGRVAEPVCEECARSGADWVSLRRCLTCRLL